MVSVPQVVGDALHQVEQAVSDASAVLDAKTPAGIRHAVEMLVDPPFNVLNWESLLPHANPPDSSLPAGPGFVSRTGVFYPVRALTGEDTSMLNQFFTEGLSDTSRYTRFLAAQPNLPHSAVAYLANRNGRTRVALVALSPECDKIVGIAEYAIATSEPQSPPEVAYAVADDYQGQGIADNLVRMLATLSIAGGFNEWSAEMFADNRGARHLLHKVGTVRVTGMSRGVESLHIHLDHKKVLLNELVRESTD